MKKTLILIFLIIWIWLLSWCSNSNWNEWWNLTEEELETFFRQHTVEGNNAVALKINFIYPLPWIAYVATIHWYPDNKSVCEELIAPYNNDPSLSVAPWSTYYCEILAP